MGFPYQFVSLDPEQEVRRRRLLDSYGQFAQLSILLIPLIYQLGVGIRLLSRRLYKSGGYQTVKDHSSPVISSFKQPSSVLPEITWSRINWIVDEDIRGYGTLRHWLIAGLWALWLLVLTMKDTGDDYLHLTKRFAIIAASQLPLHYLLAAKEWSPIQYLTRMSHEELNPYHRLLGRIIITFMALHASMYLNFYVQKGLLLKRIQDRDVILGLTAISSALLIGTTALSRIRDWNYRLFFYLHVSLSIALLPILYLHVSHLRIYILESVLIYVLLILQRNVSQAPVNSTVTRLPETNLLSITIPLTEALAKRTYKPGQHLYLGFPSLPQKLRINPFSIANPDPYSDKHLHLVARTLSGTTAMLADLGSQPQPTPLLIEGPYGSVKNFPDLTSYDRVLLVAGGVGATFTFPLYCDLLQRFAKEGISPPVRFVWSVRAKADAQWGIDELRTKSREILAPGIEVYITGNDVAGSEELKGDEIELQEREVASKPLSDVKAESTAVMTKGRPNFGAIVDEVFVHDDNDKIAILVCGPGGMGAAVRKQVGRWVRSGRDVFWHSEEFGW